MRPDTETTPAVATLAAPSAPGLPFVRLPARGNRQAQRQRSTHRRAAAIACLHGPFAKIVMTRTTFVLLAVLAGPHTVRAADVDRAEWMRGMEAALPEFFCQPRQYFRQCFRVSDADCRKLAASTARTCLERYRPDLPPRLAQPADGIRWGNAVGSCAGTAYEKALTPRRINSAKCNDPAQWTGAGG